MQLKAGLHLNATATIKNCSSNMALFNPSLTNMAFSSSNNRKEKLKPNQCQIPNRLSNPARSTNSCLLKASLNSKGRFKRSQSGGDV